MMKGDDGGYYIPEVKDGVLNWTPSEDYMPEVDAANVAGPNGDKGDKGDKGDQGIQGPEGPIGSVGPEGPKGESGIYVGTEEPSDPDILVWLVPTGEVDGYVMTENEVKDFINTSLVEVEYGTY